MSNKPIPKDYSQANAMLGKRESLIVANNTRLARADSYTVVMLYHETDVVTYYSNGEIVLTSGGWRTLTTKERLNWVLHQHGYSLYSESGRWYVSPWGRWNERYVFADGLTLDSIGQIRQETCGEIDLVADKKLKARLQRFAKLCAEAVPLDRPSGGDCWFCYMVTEPATGDNPQTLGDATDNIDHLDSHIDEGYIVPSLVYNALHESGPAYYWGAFKGDLHSEQWAELARHQVKRSVYRYLLKRYGFGR